VPKGLSETSDSVKPKDEMKDDEVKGVEKSAALSVNDVSVSLQGADWKGHNNELSWLYLIVPVKLIRQIDWPQQNTRDNGFEQRRRLRLKDVEAKKTATGIATQCLTPGWPRDRVDPQPVKKGKEAARWESSKGWK
jgi:hypothetical protein